MEQGPQGAGVASLLQTAPRAAATGPAVRHLVPGTEELAQLLHLSFVDLLRQSLVAIRAKPLQQ